MRLPWLLPAGRGVIYVHLATSATVGWSNEKLATSDRRDGGQEHGGFSARPANMLIHCVGNFISGTLSMMTRHAEEQSSLATVCQVIFVEELFEEMTRLAGWRVATEREREMSGDHFLVNSAAPFQKVLACSLQTRAQLEHAS